MKTIVKNGKMPPVALLYGAYTVYTMQGRSKKTKTKSLVFLFLQEVATPKLPFSVIKESNYCQKFSWVYFTTNKASNLAFVSFILRQKWTVSEITQVSAPCCLGDWHANSLIFNRNRADGRPLRAFRRDWHYQYNDNS